ncbi:MAG: LysM peptidoglycan-binding domain-containing protein [Candidatus Cellulosilyticum pullistercoris]|uniref:LysM peptidoglycan-binding domain-containing protein n=1 Tax=Candidatus Cellulosilyticum pullistercoris TaxID=2838521 RepID=A0A9E2KCT3_9FIRM|nr:LysM peptidoglycan-binding domain-containing protein [Candidatus Cellulosilyticum pullistercoris]
MGKLSYRPKKNQAKQDVKKQYSASEHVKEKVEGSEAEEKGQNIIEKITVMSTKKNTGKLENIKVVGDMDCAYHIYIEDYVYTYIYQLGAADLAKESSAILIGEIYNDSKEAIVRGIIPINMDKLGEGSEWIDMGTVEEVEHQRKAYFKDQEIIGWMHMQPGYGTMLTMKELREHQDVFEGNGTICMLVDAINKIETLYVYEDEELKEQSGYCMYYERNEDMQQFMLDHPFTSGAKEEIKDTVVNQFREIGKMRKAEYAQRKNLNLTVMAASIILIALTAVIVKMNDNKNYNEAAKMVNSSQLTGLESLVDNEKIGEALPIDDPFNQANIDAIGTESAVEDSNLPEEVVFEDEALTTPVEEGEIAGIDEGEEIASEEAEYDIYIVQTGDTLADICYKEYGNAKRSMEVAKFNGLTDTNQIYVGQELKMPK